MKAAIVLKLRCGPTDQTEKRVIGVGSPEAGYEAEREKGGSGGAEECVALVLCRDARNESLRLASHLRRVRTFAMFTCRAVLLRRENGPKDLKMAVSLESWPIHSTA